MQVQFNPEVLTSVRFFLDGFKDATDAVDRIEDIRKLIQLLLANFDLTDATTLVSLWRAWTDFKQSNLCDNMLDNKELYEYLDSLAELFELETKQQIIEAEFLATQADAEVHLRAAGK